MSSRTNTMVTMLAGALLLGAPSVARAHEGPGGNLGVGLGVGAPTGLSLELQTHRGNALELALGLDAFDNGGGYFHVVDKLSIAHLAYGPTVVVPLYIGIGGYVFDHDRGFDQDGASLGVRAPLGVNFDFQRAPMQVFAELALGLEVVDSGPDDRDLWLGGYAGFRYWF